MKRRTFVKAIPLGLAGAVFSLNFPSLIAAVAGENHTDWSYDDPESWGELSADYQVCSVGNQQSPIDLQSPVSSELQPIEIVYQDIPLKIINNSHTIQVNSNPGNYIIIDGKKFDLLQFHFHHPSEHKMTGKAYPMEVHFVHKNQEGSLAVLGVFLQEGEENATLKSIWEAMPSHKSEEKLIKGVNISLPQLLPDDATSYRYFGSLTTPPCSEVVQWIVFQNPLEISSQQINQFRQIFPLNARPIQPLNRRFLLSFSE
ncbi:carbonic anhydrase family protein [Crocosphaera sp. UHCC 0190]|uniref:carbonic anhydrase n=1 Tax=Crocosphaera sp. UHCC 0190 TaxID=3110246 RepID=UPI002B20DEF6|nr:carbonic anhydrase family protein [Crocosphaera sp. UHCC 0190]MEA5511998.1 carbonic anhydrase family protein [Crocosphaera sp. UHCC 0190]